MAEEKDEEILLTVAFDEGAVEKRLIQLRKQSEALRAEKAALKKANKDGVIDANAYAKSLNAVELSLKANSKEIREQEQVLLKVNQTQEAASGSILQMRANLSLLTSTWDGLSASERNNAEVGGKLEKQIKTLSDNLLNLESSTGRNQRNVGAYGNAISRTTEKIVAATAVGKDYIRSINVMGVNVGQTVDSFKSGTSGVATFTKAVFTGRGALIALGAVPIVLLFTGLITLLTKTQAGMDFVAKAAGAVENVFSVLIKSGIGLTKAFIELFTSPTTAIESFKNILKGLPNDISNAVTAGVAIVEMNQKIRESERALRVERSAARAEIEKQKKLSEDVTQSQQAREDAAQAAYAIENDLLQKQTALQRQRVAVAKEELKQSLGNVDALDKVAEAEIALNEVIEESTGKQTELQNQLNQIRIEGAQNAIRAEIAVTEKAIAEAKQRGEFTYELEKKLLNQKLSLDKVGITAGSDQEKALTAQYDLELAKLKLDGAHALRDQEDRIAQAGIEERLALVRKGSKEEFDLQRQALQARDNEEFKSIVERYKNQEEFEAQIKALNARTANENKAIDKQERDAQRTQLQADIDFRLAHTEEGSRAELRIQLEALQLQREAELDNEDLTEKQKMAIRAKFRKSERDLQKQFNQALINDIISTVSLAKDTLSTAFEAQSQTLLAALDKQQQAALKSAGANADLRTRIDEQYNVKREKLEKEAAEKRRKIASIENLIATAQATTTNLALFAKNPILGAITELLILAKAAKQQQVIDSAQFAEGGVAGYYNSYTSDRRGAYVRGPGSGKSDSISAKISNGESIINAKSTAMFYDQLSALNVAGGGRAFPGANGAELPQIGNFMYGGVPQASNNDLVSAVVAGMKAANLVVAVTDINKVQDDMTYAKAQGNI